MQGRHIFRDGILNGILWWLQEMSKGEFRATASEVLRQRRRRRYA